MLVVFRNWVLTVLVCLGTLPAWAIDIDAQVRYKMDQVQAGNTQYVALSVQLEQGYHVNSNAPLDPYTRPTILTISTPDGIEVKEIAYPEAIEKVAGGLPDPMSLFEEHLRQPS